MSDIAPLSIRLRAMADQAWRPDPLTLREMANEAARLEHDNRRMQRALDEMAQNARADAEAAERAANVVRLRPALRAIGDAT
jgi:hypothetical protein